MFYLIGLGICKNDISLNGFDALKNSEKIFYDTYTNLVDLTYIKSLEKKINKKFIALKREQLESEKILIENSKDKNCALLVCGDPLISTTHQNLIISCKKNKIKYKVFHASSIFSSAIGVSGLSNYKFSRSTSITFFKENYKPTSFFEILYNNNKNGYHTLIYLDIDPLLGAMDPKQAIKNLLYAQKINKKRLITKKSKFIILSKVGEKNQKIMYYQVEKILKKEFKNPPYIMIFQGKTDIVEEEFLKTL